jgi:hypothetical protein
MKSLNEEGYFELINKVVNLRTDEMRRLLLWEIFELKRGYEIKDAWLLFRIDELND